MTVSADRFAEAIMEMRASWHAYDPRLVVLENWSWRHSVERLLAIISPRCNLKQGHAPRPIVTRSVGRSTAAHDIGQ